LKIGRKKIDCLHINRIINNMIVSTNRRDEEKFKQRPLESYNKFTSGIDQWSSTFLCIKCKKKLKAYTNINKI